MRSALLVILIPLSSLAQNLGRVDQGRSNDGGQPWAVSVTNSIPIPAGASTAANQTTLGNQTTKINDGTDTAQVTATSGGALQVECVGGTCGGAVAFEDNDPFTPGTSAVANAGLEVDDTATSAVTENSAGAQRMTTFRAAHTVLRDGAGNERSASVTAGLALLTDSSATTQPVSGTFWQGTQPVSLAAFPDNEPFNVAQINGVTPLMGNGITGTGSQRVTIASDNTAFSVNVGTFPDNEPINVAQMNGVTVLMGVGASGTGAQRTASLIHDGTDTLLISAGGAALVDGSAVTQPVSLAAFPDNEPFNMAQANGVAVLMGAGATGTGSLRVTLATDTVAQATASSLNAEVQGDAAHAAAVSGNPLQFGAYAESDAAALDSTGVAEGEATRLKATVEGQLLVRIDHPNRWSCTVDAATADTQCQATATSLYLTDVWLSNGATAQGLAITYGTGAACVTGRTVIFPTTYLPVNGGGQSNLITAYKVPASQNVCCDTNGSTAFSCRLGGFTAP